MFLRRDGERDVEATPIPCGGQPQSNPAALVTPDGLMVASARAVPHPRPEQRGREALRESGERKRPSLDVLTRLAKALKVTVGDLVE